MDCPFCGCKMVSGHMQSGRVVFFTQNKRNWVFQPSDDDVVLTIDNWTCPTCVAYLCKKCKKVIVDYR